MSGRYENNNNKNETDQHETVPAVFLRTGWKKTKKKIKIHGTLKNKEDSKHNLQA